MSAHRLTGRLRKKGPARLAVVFGVLGLSAVAGPAVINAAVDRPGDEAQETSLAALPADKPAQGLVYSDLKPAADGSLCSGAYELDQLTCTHGPDGPPAGLRVRRAVAPVTAKVTEPVPPTREDEVIPQDAEIVRDQGGSMLTEDEPALVPDAAPGNADFVMGSHDVACDGDGRSGNRVQVVYVHEFGTPSRFTEFLGSIRVWAAGIDQIFDLSAAETGGSRHVRYVTTPACRVDVAEIEVPRGGLTTFSRSIAALQTLGYNRTDRKYLLFADTGVYCGISTFVADTRPGAGNRNNGGPSYSRVDSGCWSTTVAAHQLTHALGAVLRDSPNATGDGGCTDEYDLLCGPVKGKDVRERCPKKHENRLDCGHDDYFSLNPPKDSYLATHWNVAKSDFLLRSDGGDDLPDVPGAPAPAARGGDVTDGGGDAVQAFLEVRDTDSNAVRLQWSAVPGKAQYQVAVNGVPIATTTATRARLIGLKPDTTYQVTVSSAATRYTAKAPARTGPFARPTQNSWFVMENALTGGAADLYAARTADGTAITLSGKEGDAQQQWMLVPAEQKDTFSLKSRATGKCAVPLSGNAVAGAPLVQGACGPDWKLQLSDYGFTLRTAVGDLVAGVGTQRFAAQRVLVLQTGDGSRHQSWTAVPG